jgi:hypothetical protein
MNQPTQELQLGRHGFPCTSRHAAAGGRPHGRRRRRRVLRRQAPRRAAQREADQDAQIAAPAPAPSAPSAAPTMEDEIEQIKQLAQLHSDGILTDEEFSEQKQATLGS